MSLSPSYSAYSRNSLSVIWRMLICLVFLLTTAFTPKDLTTPPPKPEENDQPLHEQVTLPNSEIIFSISSKDFDTSSYANQAAGFLATYNEYLKLSGWHSGAQVIDRIAADTSINPRLLLSLVEFQSHWATTPAEELSVEQQTYPVGYINPNSPDLYLQLKWASRHLSTGYYGWRYNTVQNIQHANGTTIYLSPEINAATAALYYFFAQLYPPEQLDSVVRSFSELHTSMYGDPWQRDQAMGPIFPPGIQQPELILPFSPGHTWNFTGGPHPVWDTLKPDGALDFAPAGTIKCNPTEKWVAAAADGLVIRSGSGLLTIDLDGDGSEQTGWVLLYVHIGSQDKVPAGTYVKAGDFIGYPSCEGGWATGSHIHIARKYNGEWVAADGFLPFVLSGWQAVNGDEPYEGLLVKNEQIIPANTVSSWENQISRKSP